MTKLNRSAYQKMIDEDIEWLHKQTRTLERDHVVLIVRDSINWYYDDSPEDHPTHPLWDLREHRRLQKAEKDNTLPRAFAKSVESDKRDQMCDSRRGLGGLEGTREDLRYILIAAALRDLRLVLRRPQFYASTREGLVGRLSALLTLAGCKGDALNDVFMDATGATSDRGAVLDNEWAEKVRQRTIQILNTD